MSFTQALDTEIAALAKNIEDVPDPRLVKLRELKRVRALYGDARAPTPPQYNAEVYAPLLKVGPIAATNGNRTPGRKPSPERVRAVSEAFAFLRGKTEPTRTADIHAHLVARGIQLAGDDPQNNLSAMLNKSVDFRSHGRAGWTLARREDAGIR